MGAKQIVSGINQVPWGVVLVLCATLGLAPFSPPHIVEKISMLITGNLTQSLDWFDLCLHGFPWVLLILKGSVRAMKKG